MASIEIKKGLDIPIEGHPEGKVQPLKPSGQVSPIDRPSHLSLNLSPFENTPFKLLVNQGDVVKCGQPLAFDKRCPERKFVSPAGGVIKEIQRGLKRRLLNIVIEVAADENVVQKDPLDLHKKTRSEIASHLAEGGIFAYIRKRPFDLMAKPNEEPRAIFVKAIESAPFTPPPELQVEGNESLFATGLETLKKLTEGNVHLIFQEGSKCNAFTEARDVKRHTAKGPHPIANPSVHIQKLSPIRSSEDVVWTLDVLDVIRIGSLIAIGRPFIHRVLGIGGPGIIDGQRGYFRVRDGTPVHALITGRIEKETPLRLISGDPLMGEKVEADQFLRFYDTTFTVIPEPTSREFLHFLRPGLHKYTASKTYLSKLFNKGKEIPFTTSLHGEKRPFITAIPYDKVQPLPISTMLLVKSVMAEDFETAEALGLLEIAPEDFALPTFVCPSKIEMVQIIKRGLQIYARDILE